MLVGKSHDQRAAYHYGSGNAERIAEALRRSGFNVLGVHRLGGIDI